jgi:hypothetical protein
LHFGSLLQLHPQLLLAMLRLQDLLLELRRVVGFGLVQGFAFLEVLQPHQQALAWLVLVLLPMPFSRHFRLGLLAGLHLHFVVAYQQRQQQLRYPFSSIYVGAFMIPLPAISYGLLLALFSNQGISFLHFTLLN